MSELPEKIREYYSSASLPDDVVRRLMATAHRERRRRILAWAASGVAACLAMSLVLFGVNRHSRQSVDELEAQVKNFFSHPDSQLDFASSDPTVVRQWLEAHGGPTTINVPAGLAGKNTVGCEVFGSGDDRVFVICYVDDTPPDPGVTEAIARKSASRQPAVVHLALVPKTAIKNSTRISDHPRLFETGAWSFAEWTDGRLLYVLATDAGIQHLRHTLRI